MAHRQRTLGAALLLGLALGVTTAGSSAAPGRRPASAQRPTVEIVRVSSRGFDWADAGIGAVGGAAVSMLFVGGGLLIANARNTKRREGP